MANKWSGLKGKYPDAPLGSMAHAADSSFLEKVEARKFEYAPLGLPELMAKLDEFRIEKDDNAKRETEINAEMEALGRLIISKFEDQGVTSVKNAALNRTFYLNMEPYVEIADRQSLEAHVDADPALEYLYAIQYQSLASLVKTFLEEGKDSEVPPGLSIFLKTSVRSRKS
jgi:hypothetical protein